MPVRKRWRIGDHLVVCDRTGFTRYASQSMKEWNGLRVWKRAFEPRQPQDFVRGETDEQYVKDARPPGIAQFIGPLTTEVEGDHPAGSTTIEITSSARMQAADRVRIGLDNGEMAFLIIQSVPTPTSILLTSGLPGAVSDGSAVVNTTAVSQSDIS